MQSLSPAFSSRHYFIRFRESKPSEFPETSTNYVKTSCWKSKRNYKNKQTSPKITQAIFDSRTHKLETELFLHSDVKSTEDIKLALHFFVKDGNSTRYLATEDLTDKKVDMKGTFDMSERMTKNSFDVTVPLEWLDDLKSRENLYVVPEIISYTNNYKNYTPVFDELNATPVTLAH